MILGDIVKEYRTRTGMNMQEFADKAGLSKAYISILERNYNPRSGKPPIPSLETIKAVANAVGMDFNDVIAALDGDQKVSLKPVEEIPLPSNAQPVGDFVSFRVIGSIAAGYDHEAVEEYTDEIVTVPAASLRGRKQEEYFALRVKGNSMFPKLEDGDTILVRRCTTVDPGSIAVVLYNGDEATVKKVYMGDGWIDLIPINPEYPSRRIEGAELKVCRILGQAVTLLRDF